jgi:predicted nucleic acid-binding protein
MTAAFLDTSILLDPISTDSAEAARRDRAIALLEPADVALSVQVLEEFHVEATRATRPDRLSHDLAVGLIPGPSPIGAKIAASSFDTHVFSSAVHADGA